MLRNSHSNNLILNAEKCILLLLLYKLIDYRSKEIYIIQTTKYLIPTKFWDIISKQ